MIGDAKRPCQGASSAGVFGRPVSVKFYCVGLRDPKFIKESLDSDQFNPTCCDRWHALPYSSLRGSKRRMPLRMRWSVWWWKPCGINCIMPVAPNIT